MGEAEKPLHVRVAEAIGWKKTFERYGTWFGVRPADDHIYKDLGVAICAVPAFDTSWSATGPLVEKYGLYVSPTIESYQGRPTETWMAKQVRCHKIGYGSTPLLAICHLLLALKEAGKL